MKTPFISAMPLAVKRVKKAIQSFPVSTATSPMHRATF